MKKNVRVLISGRVQGVWFRASTKQKAEMLGVNGWVKNTNNGCVEAVFEGDAEIVDKIIEWCRSGPPLANVENVYVKTQDTADFNSFEIKH